MLFKSFLNSWLNIPIEYWETNTEEQQEPSLYTYIIPEEINGSFKETSQTKISIPTF